MFLGHPIPLKENIRSEAVSVRWFVVRPLVHCLSVCRSVCHSVRIHRVSQKTFHRPLKTFHFSIKRTLVCFLGHPIPLQENTSDPLQAFVVHPFVGRPVIQSNSTDISGVPKMFQRPMKMFHLSKKSHKCFLGHLIPLQENTSDPRLCPFFCSLLVHGSLL